MRYDRNCFQMWLFPSRQPFILFNWQKVVKFQDINNLSHSHDEIFKFARKKLETRTGSCWECLIYLITRPLRSPWIYNFTLFPLGHLIAEPVGSSLASCRWVMFLNQPASRDTRPNFAFALQLPQTQIQKHKNVLKYTNENYI